MRGESFAKIFETENGQLLAFMEPRKDKHELTFKMEFVPNGGASLDYGYDSNESLIEAFNILDIEHANKVSNIIINTIRDQNNG